MAKTVGFLCSLRAQWLKRTIQMVQEGLERSEAKEALNEYLAFEIDGATRLRKTREILLNVWYGDEEENQCVRDAALALIKEFPEDFVPINLAMLYLSYPVIADVSKLMGKLFESHDEITNTMLKEKLFDEWGERGTLEPVCRRVTLTMKELGVLTAVSRTRYALNKIDIQNESVSKFMAWAIMRASNMSYCTFSEMQDMDLMFPFVYHISKESLMEDPRFAISNFGGEFSLALKN